MPSESSFRVPAREQVLVHGATDVERRFMAAVYRWMTLGLATTAFVAYSVATSEAALRLVVGNRLVFFGLIIAELGLVIALRAFARAGGGTGGVAVNGALALYLDFVNLFLAVLRLFGSRRS